MSIVRQGTLPVGSLDHAITLNVQSCGGSHFETVTTTTPYLHRASPQDVASSMKLKKVVGGTVAWNQKIQNGNFTGTTGWKSQSGGSTLSVADGIATITHNGASALSPYNPALGFASGYEPSGVIGHVYYIYMDVKSPITDFVYFGGNQTELLPRDARVTANTWTEVQVLKKMTRLTTTGTLFSYLGLNGATSFPSGGELKFRNINIFDLTQMFGSTIADYIYSLEQAHAGDGVAWFKALFGEDYYPYNAGELMSVKTSARKTYNADNVEIGSYPLDGNLTLRGIPKLDSNNALYYDGDTYASDGNVQRKYGINTIPLTNFVYNSSINCLLCYSSYNYLADAKAPTNNNTVINGIANNVLMNSAGSINSGSDGFGISTSRDIYLRKSGLTSKADYLSAFPNGITIVYELATSTTESADAYTQSQRVGATEEFVDGRTVEIPVGNESEYKRLIQED